MNQRRKKFAKLRGASDDEKKKEAEEKKREVEERKKEKEVEEKKKDTDEKKKDEEVDAQAPDPDNKSGPMEQANKEFKKALFKFAIGAMKGTKGLSADFKSHPRAQLDPEKTRVFHSNTPKGKNRYKDVGCLDAHRVKLKDYGDNDYIHANYVKTPQSDKRFICTQAPVEATIADFWHMVLQEGCQNIIMLVNMAEKALKKWTDYYPTEKDEQIMFGDYAVSCMGQKTLEFKCNTPTEICETALRVECDGKSLKLKHYHWVHWPDRGVPPADSAVIELLQKACNTKAPVVVHCSAGVGRTGVVVMIQYVLEMIQLCMPFDSLLPILKEIRSQRGNSIQTVDQYYYIHMVLIQHFFNIELLDAKTGAAHYAKFKKDYAESILFDKKP